MIFTREQMYLKTRTIILAKCPAYPILSLPVIDQLINQVIKERSRYKMEQEAAEELAKLQQKYEWCVLRLLIVSLPSKGVFNLSNQLSNFSKNWKMQRDKTEFHKFCGLILLHFLYSRSKIAIIPSISTGKVVKF